jgi:hypothetical protein
MSLSRAAAVVLASTLVVLGAGCMEPLTWAPPVLDGTVRQIDVPRGGGEWFAPTGQDCEVRMPGEPVQSMVKVFGCRDIMLVGGEWQSDADPCSVAASGANESVALYLANFAGVAHVEGVKVRGPGFSDGVWITSSLPGSSAQVEGSWLGGFAACSEPPGYQTAWPQEHPDCFQTWAGPSALRFDKNTCRTVYEGLNLDSANWTGPAGERYPASVIDIRRTNVRLADRGLNGRQCFSVWTTFVPIPTRLHRARCDPGARDYPGAFAPRLDTNPLWWGAVIRDAPGTPDEIAPDEAGLGYRSPGYR